MISCIRSYLCCCICPVTKMAQQNNVTNMTQDAPRTIVEIIVREALTGDGQDSPRAQSGPVSPTLTHSARSSMLSHQRKYTWDKEQGKYSAWGTQTDG